MSLDKVSLQAPAKQSSDDKGIASEAKLPRNDKMNPQILLENLREKQARFAQLKKEGLIHEEEHLTMEQKLKETIAELETLIPQLEAT